MTAFSQVDDDEHLPKWRFAARCFQKLLSSLPSSRDENEYLYVRDNVGIRYQTFAPLFCRKIMIVL